MGRQEAGDGIEVRDAGRGSPDEGYLRAVGRRQDSAAEPRLQEPDGRNHSEIGLRERVTPNPRLRGQFPDRAGTVPVPPAISTATPLTASPPRPRPRFFPGSVP